MEPQRPDDLPEELAELLARFGGAGMVEQLRLLLLRPGGGPVSWDLARQIALQLAAPGDRAPTAEESARAEEAQRLAEHWLDAGTLPAPPDGGRFEVVTRGQWVGAALTGLRPLVEPVTAASMAALGRLVREQVEEVGAAGSLGGLGDIAAMIAPLGAVLAGVQAGQVIGQLSRQMLGQFDLGVPTAGPSTAYHIAVNVTETFGGWDLDPTEAAVVLALREGAFRRVYHAVPWLEGQVEQLVGSFARRMEIDPDMLMRLSEQLIAGVDPDDPDSIQEALQRAAAFRLEPTPAQRRVLEQLQGIVCLVQAWVGREVARIGSGKLPALERVQEVLRRRRAAQGDGERLLAQLLGLDLKPADETLGERFVAAVEDVQGPEGLHRALAHPENLPDTDELADPDRWLERMRAGQDVPDDLSGLADAGEAPREASARERLDRSDGGGAAHEDEDQDQDPDAPA